MRRCALAVLVALGLLVLLADWVAPAGYAQQFREFPSARPCRQFPLGTDDLGRDRLSRLLHGTRVSLLLAPTAALLTTAIAVAVGVAAGCCSGFLEKATLSAIDLFASLPWTFLLFTVRAMLPLDVPPLASVCITFALLGLLGWTAAARVIRATVLQVRNSDFLRQARSVGCRPAALMFVHTAAALRPVVRTQFWLSVPLFLMAEANLGMLGLGVTDPLPSWGNLLAELHNGTAVVDSPWLLAPAVLLVTVLVSFDIILPKEETRS